jgi:3-hydroxyacyl-[acyl-carrier-protein] dehydratase
MNSLTNQEVLEILPHRYPFLMVDKVVNYSDTDLEAIKNFTINEPYVQGHFPNNHIMPGVMMVEAMAQASTLLGYKYIEKNVAMEQLIAQFSGGFLFVAADEVRFKKVVNPGDQLRIFSKLTRCARFLFDFESRIEVDRIIVASAKLKATTRI